MEGTGQHPPAGWYEDPDDGALQRFWDGSRWTSSRMPRNEAVPLEGEELEPAPSTRYASDIPKVEGGGLPAAAWYADPENATGMRYWDGTQWTEHRTDYRAEAPAKTVGEGMVAAGYILAFLFPIAGAVIGVILMGRHNSHGRWVLALSVLFFIAFVAIGETNH
ncbi:MAG: hypothetical protein QOI10_1981 [Solirubrobacterales bacterium]|jgi:hypothetical protein|nr:hypothetical protein [Solirubrobacterales bacterium]